MVTVRTIMTMSWSISTPFMPLFLVQIGTRPTSLVEIWAGAISSASFLIAAVVSPIWGSLADRKGRKLMVVGSCTASCISSAALGLCTQPWQLLLAQAMSGVFGGFSSASMTLVATQVPEELLGFSLGWLVTGQTVGVLVGPIVGGILADHLHNFRLVFFIAAGGSLIGTAGAALFVRERFRPEKVKPEQKRSVWAELAEVAREPVIVPMLILLMLTQLTAQAPRPVLPVFVHSLLGDVPWLATAAGAAVSITGVADLLASPWLGRRSDRLGYRFVLIVCLIGSAVFTIPMGFATNYWVLLFLRFGIGVFLGGILPAANALVGRSFPRERRGQVYGLVSSATFLGMFLGPLTGGLVTARFGFTVMFLFIGTLTAANLLCLRRTPPALDQAAA